MKVKFIDTLAVQSPMKDGFEIELDCVPRVGELVTIDCQITQSEWFCVSMRKVESVRWSIFNRAQVVVVILGEEVRR